MSIKPSIQNGTIIGFWIIAVAILIYTHIEGNDAQGAGDALQAQLDLINARIQNLTRLLQTTTTTLMNGINMANTAAAAASDAAATAQAAIDEVLVPGLENVTMTAGKLVNINKTWRTNFKVVNATFMILRKKLSFRAPHIPLS